MAYSRWGKSRWYVFGCSPESVPTQEQRLSIHDADGFIGEHTYQELTDNLESVIKQIQENTGASESEMVELKGYVQAFLDEIRHEPKTEKAPK